MQGEQANASCLSEKDPIWQGTQAPAVTPPVWYCPATQTGGGHADAEHEYAPTAEHLPLSQAAQDAEPTAPAYVFTWHAVQSALPPAAYEPYEHCAGAFVPRAQDDPAGHATPVPLVDAAAQ